MYPHILWWRLSNNSGNLYYICAQHILRRRLSNNSENLYYTKKIYELCYLNKNTKVNTTSRVYKESIYRDIICESNSLYALKFIKEKVLHTHLYDVIADYIISLLTTDYENIVLVHTLQKGNSCANRLAKFEAALDNEIIVFDFCAPLLACIYLIDIIGV
jgi:hypothetical protein